MERSVALCLLLLSSVLIILCFPCGSNADKAHALFVFGDSYADTGNHSPYNQTLNTPWRRPYGFTWPGYPSGRFSSGKIQTDFWAELLGLPTPIAYELLRTHKCDDIQKKIKQGLNFAVGGSGIFADYGFITVNTQLVQFKELIADSRAFNAHEFARSVTLISVAGNDYLWFLDYKIGSIKELEGLVEPVVNGIVRVVKDLYGFGLRNFVVSDMVALGCLAAVGRTSCDTMYDDNIFNV